MFPSKSMDLRDACAAEARRIAPDLCRIDNESGESCAWYHGFWPTLRTLGLVTTPDTHAEFYAETLATLVRQGARRVLISGSADINMLEQVCAAFDAVDAEPAITFLDRCPSPVALARWYADRTGRNVAVHAGDILNFDDKPYDIVCTHSFMGFFSDAQRHQLARKWADLLRPGGKIVTINRIRPGLSDTVGFMPAQASQFVKRAREAALTLGFDAAEIEMAATRYAKRFRIRPVGSVAVLRQVFENNGFAIDRLEGDANKIQRSQSETGPTTPGGATYFRLVATRL